MNPRPDPRFITTFLFALVFACAAVPVPDTDGSGAGRTTAHLHGTLPSFLRLPR